MFVTKLFTIYWVSNDFACGTADTFVFPARL
jgi:hypothetical protein